MHDSIDVLYIAEKPSLAQAIAEVLPGQSVKTRTHITVGNTVLTWCFGHMLEMFMPEDYDVGMAAWSFDTLPFVPANWRKKPRKEAASQLSAIEALLKRTKHVVHAGDPDQEGQLIVDELLAHFGCTKPVSRILVNDYNAAKVREAVASLQSNALPQFKGWSAWAECRSCLDFLFGINLTRAFTLRGRIGGHDGVISVGRVQTPTLAIVVARDEAIDNFRPLPYYTLVATAASGDNRFNANWKPRDAQAGLDESSRLIDGAIAASLAARLSLAPIRVTDFAESAKNEHPPLPFSLLTLQGAANDAFGYTAAQTLEAAQALYETHKLTTYPRSDSRHLSSAQLAESPRRLAAVAQNLVGLRPAVEGADVSRKSAAFNDAKVTAHHAIVPTATVASLTALNERERNVYELIARSFVALFYPPHTYLQTTVSLDIGGEGFTATGRRSTAPGWKAVFTTTETAPEDSNPSDDDERQSLPRVAKGDTLTSYGVAAHSKQTKPPVRFTDKTLLNAMAEVHKYVANPAARARLKEGQGIGTPATRANIIEELKNRGYVASKGKQLISTETARIVIHALPVLATDAGFTGLTEQTLDQVAAGAIAPAVFLQKSAELVSNLVSQAVRTDMKFPVRPCPVCKEGRLRRRKGSNGYFWGCSRYDAGCKAAYDDNKGKPQLTPKAKKGGARKTTTKKTASGGAAKKPSVSKGTHAVARRGGSVER